MGRFSAILLDWDGTLIDSLPLKIRNAGTLFESRFGVDAGAVEGSYREHSGVPRRLLFDFIARDVLGSPLSDSEFLPLSEAFSAANLATIKEIGVLRPGTLETLGLLRFHDLRAFVSTSAQPEEVEPLARHFGVEALCEGVLASTPGFAKGQDHVMYVRRILGISPESIAGVGDDTRDMELFSQADISPIGITGTRTAQELLEAGAVRVIDTLGELVPILLGEEHG